MLRPLCLLALPALLFLPVRASAQDAPGAPTPRDRATCAARAIHAWVDGFVRGKIDPRSEIFFAPTSKQPYVAIAIEGGALTAPKRRQKTRHFTLLQRLVTLAERQPIEPVAEALLALSAAGYARDLYSARTIMVRDLGHFALMRTDDATIWHHILQVASGAAAAPAPRVVAIQVADEENAVEDELAATARAMRRVAAVQLLGMKRNPVFLVVLEKCLADPDPRVRLAAAEAFRSLRQLKFLYPLARRAAEETHPMVVMALLAGIEGTLKKYKNKVPIARGLNVMRFLVPLMGRKGWRNDMTIVRLQRSYPVKVAVPALIHLMRGAQAEIDPLLKVVNKDASPILANETFRTLRQITGALITNDPNKWHAFWESEKDRLQLVAPYRHRRASPVGTVGTFFGIPVVGREVVFVIDTSGSMKEPAGKGTVVLRLGKDKPRNVSPSRLDAAKEQTLNAVQGIPKSTRYHLVSFAAGVRVWNSKPVSAGPRTFRTLTQALSRLRAVGGTNVYAALLHVLNASQITFGQQIKHGVEEVFILSDGLPSVGEVKDPERILEVVRDINRYQKIRINTVFTGTGKGAEFMRKLAAENFGVFVRR